jgi:hypothetical protein
MPVKSATARSRSARSARTRPARTARSARSAPTNRISRIVGSNGNGHPENGHAIIESSTRKSLGADNGKSAPALKTQSSLATRRKFDARRDTPDLRDLLYVPTLVEVPSQIPIESYLKHKVPVLDQGREGACTGFGLATVIHYLLRTRHPKLDPTTVSPHMLYRMARRYDEWPGEEDAGSSARGAMKGWHRHGVCTLDVWKSAGKGVARDLLTEERAKDAIDRPLGAYFRVNHTDLVAMHAALAEVGILYATASVHEGWDDVGKDGIIHYQENEIGGHAFAIVAYDRNGFWIQNSWDTDWGRGGFGHISYDDWLKNGDDAWVARLGAPIDAEAVLGVTRPARAGNVKKPIALAEVRPHVVGLGNDGALRPGGLIGTDPTGLRDIFKKGGDFDKTTENWDVKRLLLYAHGGLNDEGGALQRVQDYRRALLEHQVYPVAFVWKTDYWTTLQNALEDAKKKRRPEGFLDASKDFLLNRLDDALEPVARLGTGKLEWDEMKENAQFATTKENGGARLAAQLIAALKKRDKKVEIHVVGHSAGSILHAYMVRLLTSQGTVYRTEGLGVDIKTVTMWAPACTVQLFRECYEPAIKSGKIGNFGLFTLTNRAEEDDDCGGVYHKSLLYLVSHAFEKRFRVPGMGENLAGEPILGMEWWIERDEKLKALLASDRCSWVRAPNTAPLGSDISSTALHHGAFDDDKPTLQATLARVLGAKAAPENERGEFQFEAHSQMLADRRKVLMR